MLKQVLFLSLLFVSGHLLAQQQFPTPQITDLAKQPVELSDYVGQGKPTVIAIWATWCQPCHVELDHMKSYLNKWEEEYGATVLAVSVDKRHQFPRIKPLINRKGWKYNVLVDTDGKLQRQLGFRSIPQMYILDGSGRIVRSFTGYKQGREKEVDGVIRRLAR